MTKTVNKITNKAVYSPNQVTICQIDTITQINTFFSQFRWILLQL
jgi:hypothetical protein